MSTSVIHRIRPWLFATVGCGAFTLVYGLFGHGVRSLSMDGMVLYPLLLGLVPSLVARFPTPGQEAWLARSLYTSGVGTLCTGALLRGILEIAGTTSPYPILFTLAGTALCATGALLEAQRRMKAQRRESHGY